MNEELKRDTVGAISQKLAQKEAPTRDPIELEREMHTDYEKEFYICVKRALKDLDSDFYVVVITKKERLMQNVLRNYFTYRKSCPTPEWDQAVYKYHYSQERIEFLWVVPAKEVCETYKDNVLEIHPSEKELLGFVLDYEDGTLFRLAKKLNGEAEDSPVLEK